MPTEFEGFFTAAAGVGGALVGLLFVAISVSPERSDRGNDAGFEARAGATLSVLVATLLVSLVALIPGLSIGGPVIIVAAASIITCITLLVLLWRDQGARRRRSRFVLIVIQIALFGYLLGLGLALRDRPTDASLYRSLCVLLVIFFIISISRAWELLGARDTGFIHLLAGRLDRPRQDRAGELSEDATPLEPPR